MNFYAGKEFLQQLELIEAFQQQKDYQETNSKTKFVIKGKYRGKEHKRNKNKCPALEKIYSNCKKEKIIFRWYAITKEE